MEIREIGLKVFKHIIAVEYRLPAHLFIFEKPFDYCLLLSHFVYQYSGFGTLRPALDVVDAARAKGGAAYGLLFSALFFGVFHFYPAAVVNAFVMGLLLGFIYIRSNSLYIVVILHAFNNALAMLLLTLGYAHTTLYELMSAHGLKMLYTVVYGVSLGIFLVAGYMVWKTIARLREQEQAAAEAQ